jgi:hypothetical protein
MIGPRSRYTWELGDANGTAGVAWDLLVASSLQLTATPSQPLEITILPSQVANLPTSPRAFVIARGLGGITGFDPAAVILNAAAFPPAAGSWSVRQTGNTLELVLTPGGYNAWIATTGLIGSAAQPIADPDQDGLANLIEFILGGQPNPARPNAGSAHLAPSATLTSTHLEFRHRRTHAARDTPGLVVAVEYGGLTDFWTTATNGKSGVTVQVNPDAYGPGVDELRVRLPLALAAPRQRLFCRLRATLASP